MEHIILIIIFICLLILVGWIVSFLGLPFLLTFALTVFVSLIGSFGFFKGLFK